MKLTFVLPRASLSGGVRVVATYAKLLEARGHEVTVISHEKSRSQLRQMLRGLRGKSPQKSKPKTDQLDFLGSRHVVLDYDLPQSREAVPDADAIMATWWQTAEWVSDLPPRTGRKFYLLQDYEMFDYTPHGRVSATYTLPLRKIAVSGYIRDVIARNHGVRDIAVLANGVDLDHFYAPPREKRSQLTVGFLYTPKPRKRMQLAIDAIKAAKLCMPHLQVRVFGATPPLPKHDMPSWVEMHVAPPQTEIPEVYAACDLWLFPSEAEGFGLPLLEAMACRTPVLAAPAGAAADLIDGRNGLLVEGSVEDFVRGMRHFDGMDPADWREVSDAAYATARANGWDEATDRLLTYLAKSESDGSAG